MIVFIGMFATLIGAWPAAANADGMVYLLKDFRWIAVFVDVDVCIAASSALSGTHCEPIWIKDGEAFLHSRQPLTP
jgi:hypothetical protein